MGSPQAAQNPSMVVAFSVCAFITARPGRCHGPLAGRTGAPRGSQESRYSDRRGTGLPPPKRNGNLWQIARPAGAAFIQRYLVRGATAGALKF